MSEEMKYIELVTWNKKMMLMYGDELTKTQKAIGLRSNGLHSEINFVSRGQYFSCTLADGVGGCRCKPIKRTHPYRQSVVRIYVTDAQEERLWAKACKMADLPLEWMVLRGSNRYKSECSYGPNHIKYDEWGARLSFISRKLHWWKMHPKWMICNEACAEVFLTEWPDMLVTDAEYVSSRPPAKEFPPLIFPYEIKDPAHLTPDELEYQVRHYFNKE